MRLARRGVLVLGAAALAGCAPAAWPVVAGPRPPSEPSPVEASTPNRTAPTTPTASRLASASPSPTLRAMPTREEIVAEFTDQVPTQWGLEVDGVVLRSEAPSIALTFDACGGKHGSGYDDALIQALVDTSTPATLFLNSRWIEANPQATRDLMANPLFELANHGTAHVPLSVTGRPAYGISGTGSVGEVYDEVADNQLLMTSLLGEPPRFFRCGTAHYDDVAARVVRALGLLPVNFDVNTDGGATFTAKQVRAATLDARPGSICIGHFNRPGSGTATGMAEAIVDLNDRGARFAALRDVIA